MKKPVHIGLKYSAIFIVTLILTSFLALGCVAYFSISTFHELQPKDYNLNAVAKIGSGYLQELDSFDDLFSRVQGKKMPAICSTLCNPVGVVQDELINGKTPYLHSYYKSVGNRAFQDPMFRFKLEQMALVSRTIPVSMRSIVNDILKEEGRDQRSKLWLALRLETSVLAHLPSLPHRLENFKEQTHQLELVRTLIKACRTGVSPKKISAQCEETGYNQHIALH